MNSFLFAFSFSLHINPSNLEKYICLNAIVLNLLHPFSIFRGRYSFSSSPATELFKTNEKQYIKEKNSDTFPDIWFGVRTVCCSFQQFLLQVNFMLLFCNPLPSQWKFLKVIENSYLGKLYKRRAWRKWQIASQECISLGYSDLQAGRPPNWGALPPTCSGIAFQVTSACSLSLGHCHYINFHQGQW